MSYLFLYAMIHFFSEDIPFVLSDKRRLDIWLSGVADSEGKDIEEVNFIFCNDEYLHNLNMQYLAHDTLTDVITFQYDAPQLRGDVFISIPRVKENATFYQVQFDNELRRVMVHGLLHLIGYNDKTKLESDVMRKMEDKYLGILK